MADELNNFPIAAHWRLATKEDLLEWDNMDGRYSASGEPLKGRYKARGVAFAVCSPGSIPNIANYYNRIPVELQREIYEAVGTGCVWVLEFDRGYEAIWGDPLSKLMYLSRQQKQSIFGHNEQEN